jgi:hypothetical protein
MNKQAGGVVVVEEEAGSEGTSGKRAGSKPAPVRASSIAASVLRFTSTPRSGGKASRLWVALDRDEWYHTREPGVHDRKCSTDIAEEVQQHASCCELAIVSAVSLLL